MAEENEIQILIRAIDEVTGTIKKIESNLENMNKSVKKQTEETSKAFDKQMGSLLVLGNAANSVDRIFSNYQNLQLRLENSTERVANAQDRLRKAEYNLKKVQKDVTASAEDLAEANADVDSATRSLTISQNNLERANNQVLGTYIQISLESLNLIKSLPILINSFKTLGIAFATLAVTPLGISLIALGGTIAVLTKLTGDNKTEVEETYNNYKRFDEIIAELDNLKKLEGDLKYSTEEWGRAISTVSNKYAMLIGGTSEQEARDLLGIAEQQEAVNKAKLDMTKMQGYTGLMWDVEKQKAEETLTNEQNKLDVLQGKYDTQYTSRRNVLESLAKLEETIASSQQEKQKQINEFWSISFDEQKKRIMGFHDEVISAFDEEKTRVVVLNDELKKFIDKLDIAENKLKTISTMPSFGGGIGAPGVMTGKGTSSSNPPLKTTPFPTKKVNDFILRPNGELIETAPDDTIFGTRNGIGKSVNVSIGNIYGIDATEISRLIAQELGAKLSL